MKTRLISFALTVVLLVGYVKCVIKTFKCDWDPIGKEEVFYTVGSLTGLGSIFGYINIEGSDKKKEVVTNNK